jgi:hypothetical protein
MAYAVIGNEENYIGLLSTVVQDLYRYSSILNGNEPCG